MNAVTGAFGYTGKYIARRLLARGEPVITLTTNPRRSNEFSDRIQAFPFNFARPEAMAEVLAGARVLYNTYWIRFDRGGATHDRAIANTVALLRAARMAGVRRIVHISVTNPDIRSPLPYYRGKARVEEEVRKSQISYAVVRPTLIFGAEDILINNIGYLLRKMPIFLIPGSGQYRLQPVDVEDVTRIAVEAADSSADLVVDAAGPETFSFEELVRLIAAAVKSRAVLMHAPPRLALLAARIIGSGLGDVLLTSDELKGLMANLLVSGGPATGRMRFTEWLSANARSVGKQHASELARHYPSGHR